MFFFFCVSEQLPEPPVGPGRKFNTSLEKVYNGIEAAVEDFSYPNTTLLHDNAKLAHSSVGNNIDNCTKYHQNDKHIFVMNGEGSAPVRPPRLKGNKARLVLNEQQAQYRTQQEIGNEASTAEAFTYIKQQQSTSNSLPKFSQLMTTNESDALTPAFSLLLDRSTATTAATTQTNLDTERSTTNTQEFLPIDKSIINRLAPENCVDTRPNCNEESQSYSSNINSDNSYTFNDDELPAVSQLIGEPQKPLHLSEENDDDNEDGDGDSDFDEYNCSLPNFGIIFDQHSSTNDSSLTNVTGTSEEFSFEQNMNDNSASNENIPCLNEFKSAKE